MPTTTLTLPTLHTDADAHAVELALQDLPCLSHWEVDVGQQRVRVVHTRLMDPADLGSALANAGYWVADSHTTDGE